MLIRRVFFTKKAYLIRDCDNPFHCNEGSLSVEELNKESGSEVVTTKNNRGYILDANFLDVWEGIKRQAQIIIPKDLGWIIANTSLDKTKIVVDAGTGSGGSACFLAHYAKQVYSYDAKEDNVRLGLKNVNLLQLDNVEMKCLDITQDIPQKDVDLIVLDIPQPWDAVILASKALKIGAYLVTYSPSTHQMQETVAKARTTSLWHIKSVEMQEREWKVDHQKCRPEFRGLGHTGFMSLFRRYRK